MTHKVVAVPLGTMADLECRDSAGRTCLMQTSTAGSAADVRGLLTRGANVHATSAQTSETALHYAVISNRRKAVIALLSGGADPSAVSCQGFTPLMQATRNGNLRIIKLLLTAGACAAATNEHGLTALQLRSTNASATDLEITRCLQAAKKAKASPSCTSGGTTGQSGAAFADVNGEILAGKPSKVASKGEASKNAKGEASKKAKGEASKKAKGEASKKATSKPLSKAAAPTKANKASAPTKANKASAPTKANKASAPTKANKASAPTKANKASAPTKANKASASASTVISCINTRAEAVPTVSKAGPQIGAKSNKSPATASKTIPSAATIAKASPVTPRAGSHTSTGHPQTVAGLAPHSHASVASGPLAASSTAPQLTSWVPTQPSSGDLPLTALTYQTPSIAQLQQVLGLTRADTSSDDRRTGLQPFAAGAASCQSPPKQQSMVVAHRQLIPLQHHEAALFDDQLTKGRGQQLLQKIQEKYDVQCSLQQTDSGPHTSSTVTVNGVKLQVVAGDLLQQDVEAIASALGRAPAGVVNHQAVPMGPLHALASWFGAAFRQTSNDLGVSIPTQRQQQHHLLAVGPPYTGREQSDVAALRTVVQSVLADAAALRVNSLALPLIGAGKAQWPAALAAKTQIAAICALASQGGCGQLKEVRLVDLNVVAVEALRNELSGHKAKAYISFMGDEPDCTAAVLQYEQYLKASITRTEVKLYAAIGTQSRQCLLAGAPLTAISVWSTDNKTLMLEGVEELVYRAEAHVLRGLYEALHQASTPNSQISHYPDTWLPQSTANTELFEVNLNSLEARPLVQAVHAAGATVVKVHRIQNKKLWSAFAHSQACMQERWTHEPSLPLINGGHSNLWHGTSHTEPHKIYGTEQGFTPNFASLKGHWGVGTYYATKPGLALRFGHTLQTGDLAFSTNLADLSCSQRQGLKQVLAVDVLTGKSKHLGQDPSLRLPPKLEDAQVGQRLGIPDLRYDSVSGTYSSCQTPIYITYNSAHGYPKHLITYR
ncbi:TPA: hypothetical protein ACH3X1_009718 [Trebouxia sp. C0004]